MRERAMGDEKTKIKERAINSEKPRREERAMKAEKPIGQERSRQCAHHWLFETGGSRVAVGVCKLCGAKREFRNSYWELVNDAKHPGRRLC